MSSIKNYLSADQNNWGDVLLQPIKWSGRHWSHLTQLKEPQPFYKTCEVLKNLIPLIFVILITVFSTPIGLVGSYIKSYDKIDVSFSLNLSPEISEKFKELGIDHLKDLEISQKIISSLRNNTNHFVSSVEIGNCQAQFDEKTVPTKVLEFGLPQGIRSLDIFSRAFHNKCSFETHKVGELFLKYVLGNPLSPDELKFLSTESSGFSTARIFIPKQDTTQAIFDFA